MLLGHFLWRGNVRYILIPIRHNFRLRCVIGQVALFSFPVLYLLILSQDIRIKKELLFSSITASYRVYIIFRSVLGRQSVQFRRTFHQVALLFVRILRLRIFELELSSMSHPASCYRNTRVSRYSILSVIGSCSFSCLRAWCRHLLWTNTLNHTHYLLFLEYSRLVSVILRSYSFIFLSLLVLCTHTS